MEPNKKKIIDLGILETDEVSGVKKISLVEEPAIMLDFHYFNTQKIEKFVNPSAGESEDEFISRCIPVVIGEGKDQDQAAAICYSYWENKDFKKFKEIKCSCGWSWDLVDGGEDPYICHKCGADNAPITEKFESYNDYPESAKNAAKRSLEFRDKNPNIDCGTAVGWTRANQLAKGENISEETIARMASFARHLQYKDVPYTEGCGGLMVDAWGGQAGIEWASNKLKEIRGEDFSVVEDTEMVNGIIDILLQVDDIENRKEIAIEMIKSFEEEGVIYNLNNFVKAIGLDTIDFDIDVAGLPAYVDQVPKKKKDIVTRAILAQSECDNSWTKDQYVVDTIIAVAKEIGTKEEDLGKLFDMQFAQAITPGTNPAEASQAKDRELILYKYMGDIGSDSRSFCRQMVSADLYYTKQQIQSFDSLIANPGFGHNGASYSLFKYKGGPNCKHRWNDFLVKSTKDGKIYIQDLGPAAGTAGIKPKDMAKNGYYNTVNESIFSFAAEEQQILVGPAMVPDMKILRVDEDGQKYFVKFSPETIKEIALKYFKEGRVHELNTDHEENTAGAYIFESWIVETPDDKANTLYGYDLPIGSWVISVKVEDAATWARVKAGELRGFSIEGILVDLEELEAMKTYEKIKKILGTDI
jgi:hypothetical protein